MSEQIYKVAIRFPLCKYTGWGLQCVARDLFPTLSHLPKTDDYLYDEKEEDFHGEWFFHNGVLRLDWSKEEPAYVLDYILIEGGETDEWGHCVRAGALEKTVDQLCKMFDVPRGAVHLHIYRWYSGIDEPIWIAD